MSGKEKLDALDLIINVLVEHEKILDKTTKRLENFTQYLEYIIEPARERIADNIQEGLTIIGNGKVVYVNDRACEIFGYPKFELEKLTGIELAAPEEKKRLQRIKEEVVQTGIRPKELKFWIIRKDGERRYIHNRYFIIQEDNTLIARLVVTTDITARAKLIGRGGDARAVDEVYPCPFEGVIEVITKKWTCQIIAMLGDYRVLRYSEIMKKLKGISPRTLVNRLKELESAGLIMRKAFNEIPPRVEYSLTKDGMELRELMKPMMKWATSRANEK